MIENINDAGGVQVVFHLKGGNYIHSRGFSVYHVYRHITVGGVQVVPHLKGGNYIHSRGFSVYHVYRHITEHAYKALQYFMGIKPEAPLHLLLTTEVQHRRILQTSIERQKGAIVIVKILGEWTDEFEHKPFEHDTPIAKHGSRKIELAQWLRVCGNFILERYIMIKIAEALPLAWDVAKRRIFEILRPCYAVEFVVLFQSFEKYIQPSWIRFRKEKMAEGTCVPEHLLNKEQLFYNLKRRGFEPNIVDLVHSIVSTLPPPWPVQDIHARLKTKFVDMRELGEMLEEIELNLTTVKALKDLEDGLNSNNTVRK